MQKMIYLLDSTRIFIGETIHPIDEVATSLAGKTVYTKLNPASACEDAPPVLKEGETAQRTENFKQWQVIQAQPNSFYKLINGVWVLDEALEKQALTDRKHARLLELSANAQAVIDEVSATSITPFFEQQTWQKQAEESEAWHKDNTVTTPVLETIALMRGVDVNVLRQKAYEKSVAYTHLSAFVVGQRQKIEDEILVASTIEALDLIEIDFTVTMGG